MSKSVKSRAEEQFAATQKKDRQALNDKEKAQREIAERVAKLRVKGDLIALAEDYPELKTNANFRHLHDQLIDTEDRIAFARGFFNNSVTAHNLRVQAMPAAIVAAYAARSRARPAEPMKLPSSARRYQSARTTQAESSTAVGLKRGSRGHLNTRFAFTS